MKVLEIISNVMAQLTIILISGFVIALAGAGLGWLIVKFLSWTV